MARTSRILDLPITKLAIRDVRDAEGRPIATIDDADHLDAIVERLSTRVAISAARTSCPLIVHHRLDPITARSRAQSQAVIAAHPPACLSDLSADPAQAEALLLARMRRESGESIHLFFLRRGRTLRSATTAWIDRIPTNTCPQTSSSRAAINHAGSVPSATRSVARHASAIDRMPATARARASSRCRLSMGLRGLNPLQPML